MLPERQTLDHEVAARPEVWSLSFQSAGTASLFKVGV